MKEKKRVNAVCLSGYLFLRNATVREKRAALKTEALILDLD
jgi:hypothetical protein